MSSKFKDFAFSVISSVAIAGTIGGLTGLFYHSASQACTPSRESLEYQEYQKSFNKLNENMNRYGIDISNKLDRDPRGILFKVGTEKKKIITKYVSYPQSRPRRIEVQNMDSPGMYKVTYKESDILVRGFEGLFNYRPNLRTPELVNNVSEVTLKYLAAEKSQVRLYFSRGFKGSQIGAFLGLIGILGLKSKSYLSER